jgi:hypothetical protein
MWWVAGWAVVAMVGACGVIASANSVRFERRVAREVREMETAAEAPILDRSRLAALPDPVQRYLHKALGARQGAIRTVSLRHGGSFRPSLQGSWFPIRGEQHFTTVPPGFIWWGARADFSWAVDRRARSVREWCWQYVCDGGVNLHNGR